MLFATVIHGVLMSYSFTYSDNGHTLSTTKASKKCAYKALLQ